MRLLVEDDQKIGVFVEKGLRQEGHAVDWVRAGDEGVAALTDGTPYDVAVVDIMPPGRDGFQLIRAVRRKRIAPHHHAVRPRRGGRPRGRDGGRRRRF